MGLYNLLLPLKLDWTPVYSCNTALRVGQRVKVNFNGKDYIAVVLSFKDNSDAPGFKVLEVSEIPQGLADISETEIKLWKFVSQYYMCTLGEVYMAAYPKYKVSTELKKPKRKIIEGQVKSVSSREKYCKPILYQGASRAQYYKERISECLETGYSALVLVPEVESATILKESIGIEEAIVFDPALTAAKRRNLANELRRGDRSIVVIGTRSSLFLPFKNLGLVIVDEEQDPSYKQTEPAPRYNGRDVACVMASLHNADLVLGSFTPSLESLYNCKIGKYSLVRGDNIPKVNLQLLDIPAEKRKHGMDGDFSKKMTEAINKASGDLIRIIRSYTREEEIEKYTERFSKDKTFQILTAQSSKHLRGESELLVILNGDSFFDRNDFRSDEKALQLFRNLSLHTSKMLIQCTTPSHPVYSAIIECSLFLDTLMSERKNFHLPPFSRIVDIKDRKTGMLVKREVLERDKSLLEQKKALYLRYGALYLIDVDPL